MTETDKNIARLEMEITDIRKRLDTLIELVKEMNKGLYGDEKNNYIGVIKKQGILESEVANLKLQIEEIKQKNIQQDIAISAKRTYKEEIMTWVRYFIVSIINLVLLIAILKGTIGPDALLKL